MDSLKLFVRNHPFAEVAAAALPFSGCNTFEAAPFSNGEFRFPKDLRQNLGRRVEVFDSPASDDGIFNAAFNPVKSLNQVVIVLHGPFLNVVAGKSTNERDR